LESKKPSGRKAPAALDTMKLLAIEIFPEWKANIQSITAETLASAAVQEE
jgi:chromosome partitioning related protein ParA